MGSHRKLEEGVVCWERLKPGGCVYVRCLYDMLHSVTGTYMHTRVSKSKRIDSLLGML